MDAIDWVFDDDGRIDAPLLEGVSISIAGPTIMVTQLRCLGEGGNPAQVKRLQFRVTAEGAKLLAVALMETAKLLENPPADGSLH